MTLHGQPACRQPGSWPCTMATCSHVCSRRALPPTSTTAPFTLRPSAGTSDTVRGSVSHVPQDRPGTAARVPPSHHACQPILPQLRACHPFRLFNHPLTPAAGCNAFRHHAALPDRHAAATPQAPPHRHPAAPLRSPSSSACRPRRP